MESKAQQTVNGKAFEYALLAQLQVALSPIVTVSIIKNAPYNVACKHFNSFEDNEQQKFTNIAKTAVAFLIDMEPRLSNAINNEDQLQLEIVSDKEGQVGDVRDVLAIRSSQNWEIGISAKNNHRAVKHSRLSNDIDFGLKWFELPCSQTYFETIKPIFDKLAQLRTASKATQKWSTLGDYHVTVYEPILNAFKKELIDLDQAHPGRVAGLLIEYLIGKQDFYKVIKGKDKVEIQACNLYGTLNKSFNSIKAKAVIQKLKLPNRLIEVAYKDNSNTTLIVTLNEGWQISFRIHNASSRIEPSLKFDIQLISTPQSLFSQVIFVDK